LATAARGKSDGLLSSASTSLPSLDDIEVVKTLGNGSFGSVEWVLFEKESYALKKMPKSRFFKSTDHSALAWNERNAMLKCNSPFVLPLECCFQTDTDLYMLTPLYIGGDLLARIKTIHGTNKGSISHQTVELYLAQMLLALDHLHSNGICHRDIKPENIFITQEGYLVLGDLGLAVQMDNDVNSKFWGQCGSYGYRSPECVRDEECDYRADIYSLGMTIYFLAFGGVPWSETKRRLDKEALTGKNTLFFPDTAAATDDLKELLAWMLEVDPKKRCTVEEAKQHTALDWIDWDSLAQYKFHTQHKMPFVPSAVPSVKTLEKKARKRRKAHMSFDDNMDCEEITRKKKPLTRKQNSKFFGFDNFDQCAFMLRQRSLTTIDHKHDLSKTITASPAITPSPSPSPYPSPYPSPSSSPYPSYSPAATPPLSQRRLGMVRSPHIKKRSLQLDEAVSASLLALAKSQQDQSLLNVPDHVKKAQLQLQEARKSNTKNLDIKLPILV
jgi:serine/threonine protein kinase